MNVEDQFRTVRMQLAKPSQTLSTQGELSLDTQAMLALIERMVTRIKTLETEIHKLKYKGADE